MNTSFGNRYANTYFSPNNKGEAMRKMRQGVRLPGWGLPMNGGQTRSATYLNQHAGSPEDLLNRLEEEIVSLRDGITNKRFFYIHFPVEDYIAKLDAFNRSNNLTYDQRARLNQAKQDVKELKALSEKNKAF